MANIWDLIVRLSGHGEGFREDIDKDKEKLDELGEKVDELGAKDPNVKVKVDTAEADAKIDEVDQKLDRLDGKDVTVNVKVKEDKKNGGVLGPLIGSLLPAASPLAAGAAGGTMGLLSGAAPAAAGGLGFGAIATTTLTPVFSALSQLKQAEQQYQQLLNSPGATNGQKLAALAAIRQATAGLDAEQKKALQSAQDFGNWWKNFSSQFQPTVVSAFVSALKGLETLMTGLGPAIKGFGQGFVQLENDASKALQSPWWKSFFSWLGQNAKQSTLDFGHAIGNLATGLAGLLKAFSPIGTQMDTGLVNLTKHFADWATNLGSNKGFNSFLSYVQQTGPQVVSLIGQLGQLIGNVLKAMAPLGPPTLAVANGLARIANTLLTANPLISTFAAFGLQTWGISRLLEPFGKLGANVADFAPKVGTFTDKMGSLGKMFQWAEPLIGKLGGALSLLGGPWGLLIWAVGVGVAEIITHWKQITAWVKQNFGIDIPAEMKKLSDAFSKVWSEIKSAVQKAWDYIKPTIINGIQTVEKYWKQVWPEIKQVFQEVWDVLKPIVKVVFDLWKAEFNAFFSVIKAVWKPFWDAIGDVLKAAWDLMKGSLKTYWDAVSGMFKVALDLLTGKWGKAWTDMKSTFGNVWNDIKGMFTNFVKDAEDFGKNIIQAMINGIEAGAQSLINSAGNLINQLKSAIGLGGGSSQVSVSSGVASMVGGGGNVNGTITVNHTGSVTVSGLTPKAVQQVNQHMYNQTIRR